MFSFFVNAEGGLTTAGYVVCIVIGVALFIAALVFAGHLAANLLYGVIDPRMREATAHVE